MKDQLRQIINKLETLQTEISVLQAEATNTAMQCELEDAVIDLRTVISSLEIASGI